MVIVAGELVAPRKRPKGGVGGNVPRTRGRVLAWHRQLIPLLAQGLYPTAIAKKLGCGMKKVEYASKLPVVQEAVAKLRDVTLEKLGEQIAGQILRDAPENLEFLQQVRRGEVLDEGTLAPKLRDRLNAAIRLLDSQVPKRMLRENQVSGQVKLVLTREEQADIEVRARDCGVELPLLPAPDAS